MYLPISSVSIRSQAIGNRDACEATLELDQDRRLITKASLKIGKRRYDIPAEALKQIEFPNLNTIQIETETGMDGEEWYSIVITPLKQQKTHQCYHISIVGGEFKQVSMMWDEVKETHIHRHFEILYTPATRKGSK